MGIFKDIQYFLQNLVDASVDTFMDWMVNVIPMILFLMIIMNTIALLIGERKIHALAGLASRSRLIRYMILPFLGAIVLCNPMALSLGRYLPEKYKPSYFAGASFFCHTSNGIFQHINPSELMIWLGISQGISQQGYDMYLLAWMYLLTGLVANFVSALVCEYTTNKVCEQKGIWLDDTIKQHQDVHIEEEKAQTVIITKGSAGYGGPLVLTPDETRNKIIYITGSDRGKDVINRIAAITGAEVIDCLHKSVPDEEVLLAVIDCAGTLRCGIYPKKGIFTINLLPTGKSGPLAKYINEHNYVSDVSIDCIKPYQKENQHPYCGTEKSFRVSFTIARFMSILIEASKASVESIIKSIIPFIAVVSLLIGIIQGSGVGVWIANQLLPLVGNEGGLLILGIICSLPFLSPILSPGAVMAQVVGVFIGIQIGEGSLPVYLALPALFAINTQAACDIIPVGLGLAEAESKTIQVGITSVLQSRFISGGIRVLIAIGFSLLFWR